jgi:cell division protein FtsW (lipid II flippase)
LSRPPDELKQRAIFWKGIGLMLLPFALILKEPDLGSALVLLPTGVVMMFVAGTPKKYLLKLGAGVGILGALLWRMFCSRRAHCRSRCRITSASDCWFISARILRKERDAGTKRAEAPFAI